MDKSWMRTSRTKKQYIDGVEAFIMYAVHNLQEVRNINPRGNKQQLMMSCPCTTCLNHIEHKVDEVQFHLFKYGIDLSYKKWDKHGEKDEQATTAQIPVNATIEFVDNKDFDMDFGLEIPTDGPATVEMVNATKESFDEDDLAKFQELLLDAKKPLYKGCPDFTKLSAIVKLLNLKGKYEASDKFFTELLGLLKKMLPVGNEMVEKTYQAKKLMRMIGPGYKKIHVCSNNCILYWKDNKELTVCPTCGISRFIPRLQQLFKLESISKDLRWHTTRRITDGVLRHLADSQTWRTIDEKFPKIAKDPRNLRLGISADGVDVNSGTRHHKPLVDDRHTLFEKGVDTYDASTKENFNLCVVMLWTINNYPVLGTLCGCPYSGFKEKNVCESPIGTLLNVPRKKKDGMNARLDLAELGIKPELFARQEKDKTTLPPAGYTLTNAEKDIFCETLSNIRVPQGYYSNFSSLVSLKDMKLIGLKSKEISLQELDKMQLELVVTLCLLEKFFPLSFFDIMIHLTVHLTREVKLCGPICFQWMYPFERCMKVIKGHVRNKNRPEGCITKETIAEETIEFLANIIKP
ncbi:hypothetical protein Tco_0059833 [Tanacetum coccineum]